MVGYYNDWMLICGTAPLRQLRAERAAMRNSSRAAARSAQLARPSELSGRVPVTLPLAIRRLSDADVLSLITCQVCSLLCFHLAV